MISAYKGGVLRIIMNLFTKIKVMIVTKRGDLIGMKNLFIRLEVIIVISVVSRLKRRRN